MTMAVFLAWVRRCQDMGYTHCIPATLKGAHESRTRVSQDRGSWFDDRSYAISWSVFVGAATAEIRFINFEDMPKKLSRPNDRNLCAPEQQCDLVLGVAQLWPIPSPSRYPQLLLIGGSTPHCGQNLSLVSEPFVASKSLPDLAHAPALYLPDLHSFANLKVLTWLERGSRYVNKYCINISINPHLWWRMPWNIGFSNGPNIWLLNLGAR